MQCLDVANVAPAVERPREPGVGDVRGEGLCGLIVDVDEGRARALSGELPDELGADASRPAADEDDAIAKRGVLRIGEASLDALRRPPALVSGRASAPRGEVLRSPSEPAEWMASCDAGMMSRADQAQRRFPEGALLGRVRELRQR